MHKCFFLLHSKINRNKSKLKCNIKKMGKSPALLINCFILWCVYHHFHYYCSVIYLLLNSCNLSIKNNKKREREKSNTCWNMCQWQCYRKIEGMRTRKPNNEITTHVPHSIWTKRKSTKVHTYEMRAKT